MRLGQRSAAFTRGRTITLRMGDEKMYSRVVHEGTHALDNIGGFARKLTVHQLEKRAFFHQRAFEVATEQRVRFERIQDMVEFITRNY